MPLGTTKPGFKEHNPSLAANSLLAKVAQSEIEVARRAALPSFSGLHARLRGSHPLQRLQRGYNSAVVVAQALGGSRAKARATAAQLDIEDYRSPPIQPHRELQQGRAPL